MKFLFTVLFSIISAQNLNAQKMTATPLTKTIFIHADPARIWEYVNDLSKWPEWAIHNVNNSKPGNDGYFLMDGPRGTSKVKIHSDKKTGILDHDFIDPAEGHWVVPCRVVAMNGGALFIISFTKPAPMSDEDFNTGMKLFDDELAMLKKITEEQFGCFNLEQIRSAHSKVNSGADFPAYVKELLQLGVKYYETFVADGHTVYCGGNGFRISSPGVYESLVIADIPDKTAFEMKLKLHQQGRTDYPAFCNDSAKSGIEKWVVDMNKMTCIYYDKKGNEILKENIPQ